MSSCLGIPSVQERSIDVLFATNGLKAKGSSGWGTPSGSFPKTQPLVSCKGLAATSKIGAVGWTLHGGNLVFFLVQVWERGFATAWGTARGLDLAMKSWSLGIVI